MLTKSELEAAGIDIDDLLNSTNAAQVRFWSGTKGATLWIRTDKVTELIEFPANVACYGRLLFQQLQALIADGLKD